MKREFKNEYSYHIHEIFNEYSFVSRDIHQDFMNLVFFGEQVMSFGEAQSCCFLFLGMPILPFKT